MQQDDLNSSRPLTTGEVAQFCHVTHRAVLKWVASGRLKAYRTPGNHSRVRVEDFIDFLKSYNMPIPPELLPIVHKNKILIVDDDRGIVHSVQRMFMIRNDFVVDTAYDGFEAGAKFVVFHPNLVILDIRMPGIDGYHVCANIRKEPKNDQVRILAISGTREAEEIEKIMNLGADDFLEKPFSNADLQAKVHKLLGITA